VTPAFCCPSNVGMLDDQLITVHVVRCWCELWWYV